jgi:drug/metabolite transporter (DMT)-like permease
MLQNDGAPRAGASASLLVLAMGFGWGFNWVATHYILHWLHPWTMRALGIGLGALTLFIAGWLGLGSLSIPRGQRHHLIIAAVFNVLVFNVCSGYALIYGTTSRAVVIAYSMPIWSALLSPLVLKERVTAVTLSALALCIAGLGVLIWPLMRDGLPLGALFPFVGAVGWAVGTVYLKWANIRAGSLAITAWQLFIGFVGLAIGALWFDGLPSYVGLPAEAFLWIAYNGVLGMGLAYFLWFLIVERLPAMSASFAALMVPVIGVILSALIVGERPNLSEAFGFALILAAASCVLLQPVPQSFKCE